MKEKIRKSYEETGSYAATGLIFGLSRQRIHQIVTGYRTYYTIFTDRPHKNSMNSLRIELFKKPCSRCGGTPKAIHHLDGNHRNNTKENLIPVCKRCHGFFHSYKNGFVRKNSYLGKPCYGCDRILGVEIEAIGRGLCKTCYEYITAHVKRRLVDIWNEHCKDCGSIHGKGRAFRRGLCNNCYHRMRRASHKLI